MSVSDIQKIGYPKSQVKRDWIWLPYCGGAGAEECPEVLTSTKVTFFVETNPYLTYNRGIILQNPVGLDTITGDGLRIFADTGAGGGCDHNYGAEITWYLALSADGILTDQEIINQGLTFSGSAPYNIEINNPALIPQPTNSLWDNKIYFTIYWGVANTYVAFEDLQDNVQYLRVVKHDYEVKQ